MKMYFDEATCSQGQFNDNNLLLLHDADLYYFHSMDFSEYGDMAR